MAWHFGGLHFGWALPIDTICRSPRGDRMGRMTTVESLERRSLLTGLAIDPVVTTPIDEGGSASYELTIHDDDHPSAAHQYQLDWGDGGQYTSSLFDHSLTTFATPTHLYRDNGPLPDQDVHPSVIVWSKDENGNILDQADAAFSQVVRNVPPLIDEPLVRQTVTEGQGLDLEYLGVDPGLD